MLTTSLIMVRHRGQARAPTRLLLDKSDTVHAPCAKADSSRLPPCTSRQRAMETLVADGSADDAARERKGQDKPRGQRSRELRVEGFHASTDQTIFRQISSVRMGEPKALRHRRPSASASDQLELGRLYDRQVGRLCAFEGIVADLTIGIVEACSVASGSRREPFPGGTLVLKRTRVRRPYRDKLRSGFFSKS